MCVDTRRGIKPRSILVVCRHSPLVDIHVDAHPVRRSVALRKPNHRWTGGTPLRGRCGGRPPTKVKRESRMEAEQVDA